MIEDSVESFILQYKPYAVSVEIVASIEGSPLIECSIQAKVLHFLERTGPYLSSAGKKMVILNVTVEHLSPSDEQHKSFEVLGLSRLKARGLVIEHQGINVIVDVGITLVVSCLQNAAEILVGDWVAFEGIAPIHGFVIAEFNQRPSFRDEDSL